MDNLSDLFGGDALSSGTLLNDFSQQMPGLDSFQADSLSHQAFGIEDGALSGLFGADGGLMGSDLGADHQGMAQVTDADWANLSHLADGSGALAGIEGHGAGLVGGLASDWSAPMGADHQGMAQGTDLDWDNLTNLDGRVGADLTTPFSAQDMVNNPSQRHFGSDPVSSVPKIDDMSINQYGWVYKGDDQIGEIKRKSGPKIAACKLTLLNQISNFKLIKTRSTVICNGS